MEDFPDIVGGLDVPAVPTARAAIAAGDGDEVIEEEVEVEVESEE